MARVARLLSRVFTIGSAVSVQLPGRRCRRYRRYRGRKLREKGASTFKN